MNYNEFLVYYGDQHRHQWTRRFHALGIMAGLATAALAPISQRPLMCLGAAIAIGYALPWASHLIIEGNRPATFRHSVWSFRAAFQLFFRFMRGLT